MTANVLSPPPPVPAGARPYDGLTPDLVLDAVESLGFLVDGRLLALNSYENRVWQVGIDEAAPLIAKFYRPGRWSDAAIREEHSFTRELADLEIPALAPLTIGGETLHRHGGFRFSLTPRHGGRTPELDAPEVLERIGRLLGRIHAVGALGPFRERARLDIDSFGRAPADFLLAGDWLPGALAGSYREVLDAALAEVAACYARAGDLELIRLHGDCHRGNLLWTDAGAHFVDFDDACTGPGIQDLWMLLDGTRAEMSAQLNLVLTGYEDFREFDPRELHLLEALRTLRLIHHAGWLARRWDDPAFPLAFPWFNTEAYWHEHIMALREQIGAMQAGPLSGV